MWPGEPLQTLPTSVPVHLGAKPVARTHQPQPRQRRGSHGRSQCRWTGTGRAGGTCKRFELLIHIRVRAPPQRRARQRVWPANGEVATEIPVGPIWQDTRSSGHAPAWCLQTGHGGPCTPASRTHRLCCKPPATQAARPRHGDQELLPDITQSAGSTWGRRKVSAVPGEQTHADPAPNAEAAAALCSAHAWSDRKQKERVNNGGGS